MENNPQSSFNPSDNSRSIPQVPPAYSPQPMQPPFPMYPQQIPSAPQPPRKKPVSGKKDIVYAIILAILCIALIDTILWASLGLFASVSMGLIGIISFFYLWKSRRKLTAYNLFCVLASVGCDATLLMHDNGGLKFVTFIASITLLTIGFMDLTHVRRFASGTIYAIGDFFRVAFGMTFGKIGGGLYALFHKPGEEGTVKGRKVGSILLGFAIAAPLVCLILPLLISSDAAFETMMNKISIDSIAQLIVSVLFGAFLCILLFGQIFHLPRIKYTQHEKTGKRGLDPAVILSFLCVVCVVYFVYLLSQLAYFFNGFRGLLPQDYTVAEYARRGFAEMCVLCILNLAVILFALMLCRTNEEKPPVSVRLPALFLCLISLLFVSISMSKMVLYIQRYGMTQMRILTSGFMLVMASLFIGIAIWLFVKKFPYLKLTVITAALVVLVFGFGNVDRTIACYNVRAYQNGTLSSIDVDTLEELSSASVPYLVELLDDSDPTVAERARNALQQKLYIFFDRENEYETDKASSWKEIDYDIRGFNIDSYRAQKLLKENLDRIAP